jgi:hypothetical protein
MKTMTILAAEIMGAVLVTQAWSWHKAINNSSSSSRRRRRSRRRRWRNGAITLLSRHSRMR